MDDLLERVVAGIRTHRFTRSGEPVVVGFSGGADSLVLMHILHSLDLRLTAVHVNYRLRGAESDADEAFVRAWCAEREIDCVVMDFNTTAEADARGRSVQETARDLRYEGFETVAHDAGARVVALGHHRDDQAETLLLNLFRGTGPEGLAGMPRRRPIRPGSPIEIVRPLLEERRAAIEHFARAHGLAWRDDATNDDAKYRRGALRGEVFPLLEEHFGPAVTDNVARAADLVRAYVEASLHPDLQAVFSSALADLPEGGAVRLDAAAELPGVLRRRLYIEALRRWVPAAAADAVAAEQIDGLASSQPGRTLEFGGAVVWRERDRLLFVAEGRAYASEPVELFQEAAAAVSGGTITASSLPRPPDDPAGGAPNEVYLDARFVDFPLLIRPWQQGDRFVPLGMRGSKKLSDFLTDIAVPPHRKAHVPVVVSGGRIVWAVPFRIAACVRLRADSRRTIRLRFTPSENTVQPRT